MRNTVQSYSFRSECSMYGSMSDEGAAAMWGAALDLFVSDAQAFHQGRRDRDGEYAKAYADLLACGPMTCSIRETSRSSFGCGAIG